MKLGRPARRARILGVAAAIVAAAVAAAAAGGAAVGTAATVPGWRGTPRSALARYAAGRGEGASGQPAGCQGPIEFYTMDMCPYAQRTWIALEEKGIDYVRRVVDLRNETAAAWYKQNVNPLGKVPSIKDALDGTVVYESEIVNEYLEQRFADCGPRLMPGDAAGCAAARLWNHHLGSKLAPAHFTYLMNKDPATEGQKREALEEALRYYDEHLVGPFLVGEQFTLADVNALPFFERLVFSCRRFKGYEIPQSFQRVHGWLARALARPAFLATKRPEAQLEAVYKRFLAADYKFGGLNRN